MRLETLMFQACCEKNIKKINALLKDPNLKIENDLIDFLISEDNSEILEVILKDDNITFKKGPYNPLINALVEGKIKVFDLLLKDGRINPGDCGQEALKLATKHGYLDAVKLLLNDPRVDPMDCYPSDYLLIKSVSKGFVDIVKLLLDNNIVNEEDTNGILENACEHGHTEVVKLLIEDGRFPITDECLYYATVEGYHEIVELLLNQPYSFELGSIFKNKYTIGELKALKLLLCDKRCNLSRER